MENLPKPLHKIILTLLGFGFSEPLLMLAGLKMLENILNYKISKILTLAIHAISPNFALYSSGDLLH